MTRPRWLEERLAESPELLRSGVRSAIENLRPDGDLAEALLEAACRTLDAVRGRLEDREAAFELLVADGLLTLACEAAAKSDADALAERCRAMGPGGRLGRLAGDWAGRG